MATVKEVKIQKDGAMVSPIVLADSVKNLDGTKFKDSVYTKAYIDARKPKRYTIPGTVSGRYVINVNDLQVGDVALVCMDSLPKTFLFKSGALLEVHCSVGGIYLVFEDYGNVEGGANGWIKDFFIMQQVNNYLFKFSNTLSMDYTEVLSLVIMRLA